MEGVTSFPGLLQFTLDPYLIMLSVKQGGIMYYFLSLWYNTTWDWTQVFQANTNHFPNHPMRMVVTVKKYSYLMAMHEHPQKKQQKKKQLMHKHLNMHIYLTPPLGQDMTQGQFFKRSLTGLNSEFSFS